MKQSKYTIVHLDEYEIIARWLLHTVPDFAGEPEFIRRGPAWLREKMGTVDKEMAQRWLEAAQCVGEYVIQQLMQAEHEEDIAGHA